MCEIAIFDPSDVPARNIQSATSTIYKSMSDGLGIVAAYRGDPYEYEVYKSVNPSWDSAYRFIEKRMDCYRFFVHGRMATQGALTTQNTHPLKIECPECDINYVMHNGVMVQYQFLRNQHESNGHEYRTGVDSEAIAHGYMEVPDDIDSMEAPDDRRYKQPAFVLFADNGILTFTDGRYTLADDLTMGRDFRNYAPSCSADESYNYVLASN